MQLGKLANAEVLLKKYCFISFSKAYIFTLGENTQNYVLGQFKRHSSIRLNVIGDSPNSTYFALYSLIYVGPINPYIYDVYKCSM